MPPATRDALASERRKARQQPTSSAAPPAKRRALQLVLLFVTLVLVINALVGERGLMETLRARRQHQELVLSIERLRIENARLREEARRLRSDPATIEALARQELGLIKPGEMLFIIKDVKPAAKSR
ncbi:MAG: FtsB family cell division protein [Vicinamibacterales bacterium]